MRWALRLSLPGVRGHSAVIVCCITIVCHLHRVTATIVCHLHLVTAPKVEAILLHTAAVSGDALRMLTVDYSLPVVQDAPPRLVFEITQ